jgi:predicted alpha/beta-fold hydrolase
MCVRYDSKKLEREHFLFNLPDHEFDDIAALISNDLIQAGVGKRPFIIISYSMGGVLTRHIILKS